MSLFSGSPAASHQPPATILGIETSCDETAAAVVTADKRILANVVLSQWQEHAAYGGVVPEIAARAHMLSIEAVIEEAMRQAEMTFADLTAIAATGGPGLIGGVIVGTMTGKAIASVHKKPFLAVNHLEGHALTARLTDNLDFPYLLLLASGGHCQLLVVEGVGQYVKLGSTQDDALGEAFDKVAKLLKLPMPGGPSVERCAASGNAEKHHFTPPMLGREGCDFSFSGLKTAVRTAALKLEEECKGLSNRQKADLAAAFQQAAFASVSDRLEHAVDMFTARWPKGDTLVAAGGVAANQTLRENLERISAGHDLRLVVPPASLCTDNAAMIAWAGIERLRLGKTDTLDFEPRARWPLYG